MAWRDTFAHWGHGTSWHRGRDANGQLVKLCDRCLQPLGPILVGEMITTPLPQVVPGVPALTAKRVTRHNVAPWKVSR